MMNGGTISDGAARFCGLALFMIFAYSTVLVVHPVQRRSLRAVTERRHTHDRPVVNSQHGTVAKSLQKPGLVVKSQINSTVCDIHLEGLVGHSLHERASLDTERSLWGVQCTTCGANATGCDWSRLQYREPLTNYVELRSPSHDDSGELRSQSHDDRLRDCLKKKTLVVFGDSTLRGPLLRMIKPLVSPLQMSLFAGHSFNKIVDDNGVVLFYDYITKSFLRPFERRDETDNKKVFTHMVDNYAHKNLWSVPDRKITFIIGGTGSAGYLKDFREWLAQCPNVTGRGCPLTNLDYDVIVKGPTLTRSWVTSVEKEKKMREYFQLRDDAQKMGYKWMEDAEITRYVYSALRAGDEDKCGCHFCDDDGALNDTAKGGMVCGVLANKLAASICEGESK